MLHLAENLVRKWVSHTLPPEARMPVDRGFYWCASWFLFVGVHRTTRN